MNPAERNLAARALDRSIKIHDRKELNLRAESSNLRIKNITCADGFLTYVVVNPQAGDLSKLPIPDEVAVFHDKYHGIYGRQNCTGTYYI